MTEPLVLYRIKTIEDKCEFMCDYTLWTALMHEILQLIFLKVYIPIEYELQPFFIPNYT